MVADTVALPASPRAAGCSSTASTSSTATPTTPTTRCGSSEAAFEAGADVVVLCDTNGGMLPTGVRRHRRRGARADRRPGRHPRAGRHRLRGRQHPGRGRRRAPRTCRAPPTATASGAGNANLFAVVGGLELKMGRRVLPEGCLPEMIRVAHAIAEVANMAPNTHQPYVGVSAFAHKAGLHASRDQGRPGPLQAHRPGAGRQRHAHARLRDGRAGLDRAQGQGARRATCPRDRDAVGRVVERVKELEADGCRSRPPTPRSSCWCATSWGERRRALHARVVAGHRRAARGRPGGQRGDREAARQGRADRRHRRGQRAGQRAGPGAAQRRWSGVYPQLAGLELTDYKVRILDGRHGTDAVTRVLVETGDGRREWTTVGVHANVIEASWLALADAVQYGLLGEAA